jgi:hypothetical protein
MAIWTIRPDLEVLYRWPAGPVQSCGRPDSRMRSDAEEWVMANSSPWDVIHTPSGTWVRLAETGVPA